MPFRFNLSKAIQAAGVLVKTTAHERMSRLRLLKLLYIADRESLALTGRPITGDCVVAMRHGPVLSRVYDCIKGADPAQAEWDRYFKSEQLDLVLREPTPVDDLCRQEIGILQRVAQDRADKNDWEVAEETHGFPEWKNPGETSLPIPFERILAAVGKPRSVLKEAEEHSAIDKLFESYRRANASKTRSRVFRGAKRGARFLGPSPRPALCPRSGSKRAQKNKMR